MVIRVLLLYFSGVLKKLKPIKERWLQKCGRAYYTGIQSNENASTSAENNEPTAENPATESDQPAVPTVTETTQSRHIHGMSCGSDS